MIVPSISVRRAQESDLPGLLAIYNDAVANTTSIWNETLSDLEGRRKWLEERETQGFPVLVAEDTGGIAGYATFGPFRPHEGYRQTVENSVYVRGDRRRQGIAGLLMTQLIADAEQLGCHVMVAGIEASNLASIRLHERCGFHEVARMPEVGRKFGRWLDLVLMQRMIC
ncbi:N-acetyltransferase family protein [Parvibaculum sp.]|jgi:phosphinothricin acetyltransferase|uniref:GNAT family N-acetyltransferase n=1 Tax=Parvibaculum sp. TaxID=2024848 RepID=UPI000C683C5D|nr:N-acetyltransferase family protein [Parvibaculum sp.]HAC58419.1 GNAT family N-acetyltransferase [Rhodobiaceae bacterium]MAU60847.1 GNAT family N-acetyltransferase [Parvibaculum sp.]MBO6668755.1 N-acetyltransferase [Parvibaculum sp.]MBO6691506.1 N-acetyltransferase [Parvibaculum sp.]MBO6714432.1 N-acetyltransferase [Parvibaculum sp.]|tara:strand:- start:349 stop:855 length:507 start_codon:yes stop_codon:yes gene_type:complete